MDVKFNAESYVPLNKIKTSKADQAIYTENKSTNSNTPKEVKEPAMRELEDSVHRVNQSLKMVATALEITLDEEVNDKVVRVIDTISGEEIRQIPSKDFLEWEKEYDRLLGLLFDKKV